MAEKITAAKKLSEKNTKQEIAEKAIEGSSQAKSFAELQKLLADQSRKTGAEKS